MWPSRTVPTHSCATVPVGTTGWWQQAAGWWPTVQCHCGGAWSVERGAWSVERGAWSAPVSMPTIERVAVW